MISSQLPFPLSGESYNPVYLIEPQKEFEFELLVFQTKNKNIDFEKSVIDESKDVDLPITETGTIELTFPQDDDVILEEDKIKSVPESDDVDDIPEEDDSEIIPDDGTEVIPNDDEEIGNIQNNVTLINDDKVDYAKIGGLAVLLIVMIAGFLVFKKFKDSGFKNTLKQELQLHPTKKKIIISFDDKLHIDIKNLEDK